MEYTYKDSKPTFAHNYLRRSLTSIISSHQSKKKSSLRIIEIGSGNGNFAGYLANLNHEVTGVEPSKSGYEISIKNFKHCTFINSPIQDINPDHFQNKFDIVIAVEIIEHLLDPKSLIRISKKLLSPDGLLIITTPYHGYLKNLTLSVFNKWDCHFSVDWDGGHVKFFSRKSLSKMIENEDFKCVSWHYAGRVFPLWKSMICIAKLLN